ncbi:MAG: universal stress protein [Candidatus Nanopelagicales bacterium]
MPIRDELVPRTRRTRRGGYGTATGPRSHTAGSVIHGQRAPDESCWVHEYAPPVPRIRCRRIRRLLLRADGRAVGGGRGTFARARPHPRPRARSAGDAGWPGRRPAAEPGVGRRDGAAGGGRAGRGGGSARRPRPADAHRDRRGERRAARGIGERRPRGRRLAGPGRVHRTSPGIGGGAGRRARVVPDRRHPGRAAAGSRGGRRRLDGSPAAMSALDFAFQAASRAGSRLIAVHAWDVPSYDLIVVPDGPVPLPLSDVADDEVRLAAEALAGFRDEYPDVTVEERLVRAPAVQALVDASAEASLLVVGTHGRSPALGALLGSVSHGVLHKASIPVAVVPPAPEVASAA